LDADRIPVAADARGVVVVKRWGGRGGEGEVGRERWGGRGGEGEVGRERWVGCGGGWVAEVGGLGRWVGVGVRSGIGQASRISRVA
jgi:hypothetical protein